MTRILIVDADTSVLRLLRIKCSRAGYTVDQARDGQEAMQIAAVEQPDVVIMERLMPDMDGLELIERLRDTVTPAPLFLVLSDHDTDEAIRAALDAGAADYILKPFSPQAVLERLRVNILRSDTAVAAGVEG